FILTQILNLQLVSKYFLSIIRNISLTHAQIILWSDVVCHYVLNNFKFRNLCISIFCDVNSFIDKLKNCHTLDLSGTRITDENVQELKNCSVIYLYGTKITNIYIIELRKHGCKVFYSNYD